MKPATRHELLVLELLASATTIAGMWFGSTLAVGAAWYLVSNVVWWALVLRGRMWGIVPLNIACLLVESHHLWRASS